MKALLIAAALVFGVQAHASLELNIFTSVVQTSAANGPDWKAGDSADYTLKGGIMNGTVKMSVRERVAQGTWIVQDMDLGMLGKQKVEALYSDSGEILELLVNGQKQTPPSAGDQEIVETRAETVTVPKGTFNCMYVKVRNTKDNNTQEAWIDMTTIPVAGMAKSIAQSQFGPITLELTNFKKN